MNFHQGKQMRCRRCDLIKYIVYTFPNCNDKTRFVKCKPKDNKPNKQVKFQRVYSQK